MPKKNEQVEEGIRLPGEPLPPSDDSHLINGMSPALRAALGMEDNEGEETENEDGDDNENEVDDNEEGELVTIEIGGAKFEVSKELAETYGKSKEASPSPAPSPQPIPRPAPTLVKEEDDDYDVDLEKLLENPKAVLDEFGKRLTTKVSTELRSSYEKDLLVREFWNEFYDENPELKRHNIFVRSVLADSASQLGNLQGKEARDALAQRVSQEIVSLTQEALIKAGGKKQGDSKAGQAGNKLEGQGSKRRTTSQERPKERSQPVGISDMLRERKRLRLAAQNK